MPTSKKPSGKSAGRSRARASRGRATTGTPAVPGEVMAYGFVRETVASIQAFLTQAAVTPHVVHVVPLVGSSVAFVKVLAPTYLVLQDEVVPALHDAGGRLVAWSLTDTSSALTFFRPPKSTTLTAGALVLVESDAPAATHAALHEAFAGLNDEDAGRIGFAGAPVVGGSASFVIDLGEETVEDLLVHVGRIEGMPGVRSVDTSLTQRPLELS